MYYIVITITIILIKYSNHYTIHKTTNYSNKHITIVLIAVSVIILEIIPLIVVAIIGQVIQTQILVDMSELKAMIMLLIRQLLILIINLMIIPIL